MQFLTKILSTYPFASGISILIFSLAGGTLVSLWGARKLFLSFAAKNRLLALVVSLVWYIVLFIYFSSLFFVFPHAFSLVLGVPEGALNRMYFKVGDTYFFGSILLFFTTGALSLLLFIKKRWLHIPQESPTPISFWQAFWIGTRKTLVVAFLVFVAFGALRVPMISKQERTKEVVQQIRSKKITLADVMGENLPPPPDSTLKDATIQGIDANQNGIRDDVELAIFEAYPNSARIRAALLQYALNYQLEATISLVNPETVTAVAEEGGRATSCLAEVVRDYIFHLKGKSSEEILGMGEKKLEEIFQKSDELFDFVYGLQFNTQDRIRGRENFYKGNLRSYGDSPVNKNNCDVDLLGLPN
jgi:hypothetical protein